MYKVTYILFLLSAFLYGSLPIGPLTLRQIMAVIMFIVCFIKDKRFYVDKYLKVYFIFVAFWFFSSFATGHIMDFLHDLVGYVFVAYVGYWAIIILKRKYNALHILVYTLVFLGVFDALVTVTQSLYVPVFDSFLERLHLGIVDEEFLAKQARGVDMIGISIPGLYGSPVTNGHYLLVSFIASFALQRYRFKPLGYVFSVIIFIGLFFCQQRGPFYVGILMLFFLLFKSYFTERPPVVKTLFLLFVAIIGVLVIPSYIENLSLLESRMTLDAGEDSRTVIYSNTFDWIMDNPLGGFYVLHEIKDPHNFFLNAFVYGGWLGGLFVIYVLFIQLKSIVKTCMGKVNEQTYLTFILAVAYLGVTGNSMVHNISIITGNIGTWMVWAAFLANYQSRDQEMKGWKLLL